MIAWQLASRLLPQPEDNNHHDDAVMIITLSVWAIGFLVGVGAFVGPFRWLLGRDLTHADEEFLAGKDQGVGRYFRFTTDHKVVGIQYLVLTMTLFGVGGLPRCSSGPTSSGPDSNT